MFYLDLEQVKQDKDFERRFMKAADFLKNVDVASLQVGKHPIDDGIFYFVQEYVTRDPAEANYELHKKYADIQYLISGQEMILETLEDLKTVEAFDEEKDIGFYAGDNGDNHTVAHLSAGKFALYMPGEYHMPSLHPDGKTPTEVKKIVVKIPV